MTARLPRTLLAGAAATLVLALGACGGSSSNASSSGVASLNGKGVTTTTSKTKVDMQTALLQYAKCMREHGVNQPDPQFDSNGRPQFGQGGGQQNQQSLRSDPDFQKAETACRKYRQDAFGSFQLTPEQQAQQQKSLLAFAKCMRENGVDMADPTFDANGRPQFDRNAAGGQDRRNDPAWQKASQTCRQKIGGGLGGGPGFGGPGGFRGGNGSTGSTNTTTGA